MVCFPSEWLRLYIHVLVNPMHLLSLVWPDGCDNFSPSSLVAGGVDDSEGISSGVFTRWQFHRLV
jgi:hypothetical protein